MYIYFIILLIFQIVGGSTGSPDVISPIWSLWATFIGLYMANYVVERSTGYVLKNFEVNSALLLLAYIDHQSASYCRWALTHPLSISESEKLKEKMKPNFLDMVPWYSGYACCKSVLLYHSEEVVQLMRHSFLLKFVSGHLLICLKQYLI